MSKENPNTGPYVVTIDIKLADKIVAHLKEQEFEIAQPQYTVFQAKKKGISCTLYTSGKLTVQGKDKDAFIEFFLEPEILGTFTYKHATADLGDIDKTGRIGIDESGKGDFFGPLCIAGVFAEGDDLLKLKEIGVKDSKLLSEASILTIGRKIQAQFPHHIVKINPAKYNELYAQFKNLNSLLAWGHATTIENMVLKTQCHKVVVDQFASEWVVETALKRKKIIIDLEQKHRAEEELVVAAASILARKTFVEGMDKMSKEFGIVFPKGASAQTIVRGKEFVRKYGEEALVNVGKLHFKTTNEILRG